MCGGDGLEAGEKVGVDVVVGVGYVWVWSSCDLVVDVKRRSSAMAHLKEYMSCSLHGVDSSNSITRAAIIQLQLIT